MPSSFLHHGLMDSMLGIVPVGVRGRSVLRGRLVPRWPHVYTSPTSSTCAWAIRTPPTSRRLSALDLGEGPDQELLERILHTDQLRHGRGAV